MRIAVYPGSFDPVTLGHMDIIRRAANIFDKVIVCVMVNSEKHPMFDAQKRVELIRKAAADIPNVEAVYYSSLLAEFAREQGDCVIVKGIRNIVDYENEVSMSVINKKLNPSLDTMYLSSDSEYMYLSSTIVREMVRYRQDLHRYVPECIIGDIEAASK